jgi:hypothetical protein
MSVQESKELFRKQVQQEQSPAERSIPLNLVLDYLDHYIEWLEQPKTAEQFYEVARLRAQEVMKAVPAAVLVVGSGYPYYALGVSDTKVPEFRRYFTQFSVSLRERFASGRVYFSRDGSESSLSEKGIFRLFPDIDLFVIVPDVSEVVKEQLEGLLGAWSEANPNQHTLGVFHDIFNYLQVQRMYPELSHSSLRLPPIRTDLLLATVDEFDGAYAAIGRGDLPGSSIRVLAHHQEWENYIDVIAEDLWTARCQEPLSAAGPGAAIFQRWKERIQAYAAGFPTSDAVFVDWNSFLTNHTSGKNWRIVNSSHAITTEMKERIDRARE